MTARLTLVTEIKKPARRTAFPLTIHKRGCVSASTDTWMQPAHPVSEDGVLAFVVEDGAA